LINAVALLNQELPDPADIMAPPQQVPTLLSYLGAGLEVFMDFMAYLSDLVAEGLAIAADIIAAASILANAAAETVVRVLEEAWLDVAAGIKELGNAASRTLVETKERIEEGMDAASDWAVETAAAAAEAGQDALDAAGNVVEAAVEQVADIVEDPVEFLTSLFPSW
jgi:hypothetical protein